jgi:short-subunit dehydrogenase
MVVIAVAGGSGGVGKTIVEKLLESKFDIVILSRTVCFLFPH